MPLYEYQCSACGKVFEKMQKFSDAPLTEYEGCGGKVERLISAPAFHLKGSGWYATDYAKNSSSKPVELKSEAKSDGASESKTETKTESKPAAAESKTD